MTSQVRNLRCRSIGYMYFLTADTIKTDLTPIWFLLMSDNLQIFLVTQVGCAAWFWWCCRCGQGRMDGPSSGSVVFRKWLVSLLYMGLKMSLISHKFDD